MLSNAAETEVVINQASGATSWLPVYTNYNNTRGEMIYTSTQLSQVGEDKEIVYVGFDGISSAELNDVDFKLYVKESTVAQVPTSKADLSTFTKIFDGKGKIKKSTSTATYEEIIHLDLDQAYPYTPGTSLHFVLLTHTPNTVESGVSFGYRTQSNCSGLTWWNDGHESDERPTLYRTSYSPVMRLGINSVGKKYEKFTIGSVVGNSCYSAPVSMTYLNSSSETIYTAQQINLVKNSEIHGVNYTGFVIDEDNGAKFRVKMWMENTTDEDYPSTATATPKEDLTLVYDKEVTVPKTGSTSVNVNQLVCNFDAPFIYDGTNLRVVLECTRVNGDTGRRIFFGYDDSEDFTNRTIYGESNGTLSDSRKAWVNGIPVTTFKYVVGDPTKDREPDLVFYTNRQAGEPFNIVVHTLQKGIYIDYGDGEKWVYPFGGGLVIRNDLTGPNVKIWTFDPDDQLQAIQAEDCGIVKADINTHDLVALYLKNNALKEGSLDFSNCDNLEILDLSYNQYYNFTYSSPKLRKLVLSHNDMQQLDIFEMPNLTHLDVSVNMLRSQAWIAWPEDATNLEYLNLGYNMLYEAPLSLWPNLKELYVNNNNFETLDLSANTKLENIQAFYTGLKNLDVSSATNLKTLNVMGTHTTKLALKANTALETLVADRNELTGVDLSANTALTHVNLADNMLTALNVDALTNLEYLDYSKNNVKAINLSANKKLKHLNCSENKIEEFNTANATSLETLLCAVNNLTELKLAQMKALKYLDCSSNKLATLDLAACSALERLNVYDNFLTTLNVKDNKQLAGLNVKNNSMETAQLQTLVMMLPDVSTIDVEKEDEDWKRVFAYTGNPGAEDLPEMYSDILDMKGWKAETPHSRLGDANAVLSVPSEMINTHLIFSIDTGADRKIYVDWGDGQKVEYTTETGSTYINPDHIVLGNNIKIYSENAVELGVANLGLTYLDVSAMPKLYRLACSGNDIDELDLTKNTEIEQLVCGKGSLSTLLLPDNCKLKKLYCTASRVRELDLSQCTLLEDVDLNTNRLQSLPLAACPNLKELRLYSNELTEVDLTSCPNLVDVWLGFNKLETIDISKNVKLTDFSISNNNLTEIDFTTNTKLKTIYVEHNKLTDIKLNPSITTILAGYNELEDIDLSGVKNLKEIELTYNKFKTIDLTANASLQRIWLANNQLEEVKLPSKLWSCGIFNAPYNKFTSFDASCMPYLSELVLNNNMLSGTLDLSKNGSLTQLHVNYNNLDKITYPTNSALQIVYAAFNNLTTAKVPSANLYAVDFSNNNLVAVSFAENENLAVLFLDYNNLSTINLSKNTHLQGVSVRANYFDASALNDLYNQLPAIGVSPTAEYPWMGVLGVSGNPGAFESNKLIARQKGWTVKYNEDMGVTRNITVKVVNSNGAGIKNAEFAMTVGGMPISVMPATTLTAGEYEYRNFPVFVDQIYELTVSATGYDPATKVIEGLAEGDVTITFTLQGTGDVTDIKTDAQSEITEMYNLNGVRVSNRTAAPGVYITRSADGSVTKRILK